ncbi:MAG TPA: protein translocase subunit SecD [Actinomycetota bacterium]|nr:protein translocase subunit SecD [Actinomycetota bacterium]
MNRQLFWRGLLAFLVVAGSVALALTRPPRLGLDLKGGSQIVLEASGTDGDEVDDDAMSRAVEVLRRRVDQLGVSESSLQRSGDRRIIVELPGVEDPEEAVDVIGRTAQLEFHPVTAAAAAEPSPNPSPSPNPDGSITLNDELGRALTLGPSTVGGDAVRRADAVLDPNGAWQVNIDFERSGGQRWEELTGAAACAPEGDARRLVAIVLDNEIISAPQVNVDVACNEGITGGTTVITGNFGETEAKNLALLIRAGALPVPVEVVEQRTVGPTLGQQAIEASTRAAIIGATLTILYMILYYRLIGGAAAIALLLYGVISFAVLLAINATLTLPGIAGFVLAIGMAVDSNVLVFERIREEYEGKKRVSAAVHLGFRRALSAIGDSNATTLLAAVLLFFLASGAVQGFGVTLSVGVVVSVFTALVVTRVLVELLVKIPAFRNRPKLLGIESKRRLVRWLERKDPNLIGHSKVFLVLSLVAVGLGVAGLFVKNLNYGLEFTGGRLLEYSTERQVHPEELRNALAGVDLPRAVVQESGEGNVSIRTGQLTREEEDRVEAAVAQLGGEADKERDEFIGPSIGGELRRKALLALGLALVAQLVYLAFRFRWNFGLAAVLAMFHDVLILMGVFAWLGKEIDGVFLAALLTVIGYSINDSVVVFDRIRERRRERTTEPLEKVVNDACLETFPRTINTGLGAFFILIALYVLGGESLTDFALALIIGIAVGTYSSVLVAAPLCVMLDRWKPAPQPVRKSSAARRRPATSSSRRSTSGRRPASSGRGRR